jgi:hypothetical protein
VQQVIAAGQSLSDPVPNPYFGTNIATGILSGPTISRGQSLRPFPQFGNIRARQTTGARARYNAIIFKLDRRVNNGWGGRFSYTFSKLKDDQFGETNQYSEAGTGNRPLDNFNLDREYSAGLLDRPHSIVIAPIVELPFGEGKKWATEGAGAWILGGWTVTAIGTIESGYPRQIIYSDNTGTFSGIQRPNQTGTDPATSGSQTSQERLDNWINPAAYSAPAAFTFGDTPRTDDRIRSPYKPNWDIVFAKNTRVGSDYTFQFRIELLNAFNQPKFNNGGNGRFHQGDAFGVINSQAGFMRITQITFRLFW